MADIHQKLQEEKLLRATRARRRFKAAVRNVIHNMYWLDDIADDYDPMDPKKTYLLLRKKRPKDGFSIKEKVLLRKHKDHRTQEEIKYLHKFIGGLACFRQYPEEVQLGLVGVTYFEYFGPGRIIIREHDEGHALYFLLTGQVDVTKTIWDEITNEYVEEKITTIYPGKMFGEIALLHDVPRTATVSTTAPCELLVLKKDDFDSVLKESLMHQWETIKSALSKFVYFDEWNSVIIRECCLLSKMKYFSANDIVYGDHKIPKGAVKMTYFIVEGTCKLVEHMYIEEKKGLKGKTHYRIYKLLEDEAEEKTSKNSIDSNLDNEEEQIKKEAHSEPEVNCMPEVEQEPVTMSNIEEEHMTNIEEEPVTNEEIEPMANIDNETTTNTEKESVSETQKGSMVETERGYNLRATDVNFRQSAKRSRKSSRIEFRSSDELTRSNRRSEEPVLPSRSSRSRKESHIEFRNSDDLNRSNRTTEVPEFIRRATNTLLQSIKINDKTTERPTMTKRNTIWAIGNLIADERRHSQEETGIGCKDVPKNVKLVFMQICTLSERATFFEGDLMNNRRLIAMTPVTVLLIPTYWLVTHNKGNVWKRIERYLYHRIPTSEAVFEAYKENKEWQDYKKKLRDDILSRKKFINNTTVHDVPYSIRIMSNYNL